MGEYLLQAGTATVLDSFIFLFFSLAVQGRFVFNSAHCEKLLAQLIGLWQTNVNMQ